MAFSSKNSRSTSTNSSGFHWFRFCIGLGFLLVAVSFLTPFPAAFVRALKSQPSLDDTSGIEPDENIPSQTGQTPDGGVDPIPGDIEPPPPDEPERPDDLPPLDPDQEPGDLSQFTPFKIPVPLNKYSLVLPPLPAIIPDGPSIDPIWDINELARGLSLKTELNFTKGGLASQIRTNKRNFEMTLRLDIVQPEPLSKPADFAQVNNQLTLMFTKFDTLITAGKVSGFYHQLMNRKQLEVRKNLVKLNQLITRHNYYDCETILEITAPETGRKVLWIQADMDVVSDGTDGDRLAAMPAEIVNSTHYQPFTSYRWPKKTKTPNPLLAAWEKRLKETRAKPSTAQTKASIRHMELGIEDMKRNSFLIAEYDPFIVIPLGILNNSQSPFSPSPGDYVVVVFGKKLYPAIVGDAGPREKIGEASLRLAREINKDASPYRRPVSDLTVSYIVFPKTANPVKGPPNYAEWHEKCTGLLNEIGGISTAYTLHVWEDLLAPKPEPAAPPSTGSQKQEKQTPPTSTNKKTATPTKPSSQKTNTGKQTRR